MKPWRSYTVDGFDPNDGLEGGRWMCDDERRVQVWVPIKQLGSCDCGRPKGPRTARCATCKQRLKRARRAERLVA